MYNVFMDANEKLLTVLGIALAVLLLLAIIFVVYLIRIARTVDEISRKAKSAASSMETAAKIFEKSAAPAVFTRLLTSIIESWNKKKGEKK